MDKKKTILVRVLAVLLLVAVAAVMMVIGRGHTVYFDNKDLELVDGKTYEAPYKVEVSINGEQVTKLYDKAREDRGMATCMGQSFSFSLEITEKKGGDSYVRDFSMKLPYSMDGIILNIPGLLADLGEDAYLTQFIPAVVEEDPDASEVNTDEFGDGMGEDMGGM